MMLSEIKTVDLSKLQQNVVELPLESSIFLSGPAGTGKTTASIARMVHFLKQGFSGNQVLILVPQRTLGIPYIEAIHRELLPAGGFPEVLSFGGLAQRSLKLFWPIIAEKSGFKNSKTIPTFLTMENAQYYMASVMEPMLEKGDFDALAIDRNRLCSQILDNMNKAALVGFDFKEIPLRLKTAWIGEPVQLKIYDQAHDAAKQFREYCYQNSLLDYSLQMEIFLKHLFSSFIFRQYLKSCFSYLIYDNVEEDVPVVHDALMDLLPSFQSTVLVHDTDGGFRTFLGADAESGLHLGRMCHEHINFSCSFVMSKSIAKVEEILPSIVKKQPYQISDKADIDDAISITYCRFVPEMIREVVKKVDGLIHDGAVPQEIAILSPYLSDSMRFSLLHAFSLSGIAATSHRPSRSLRDEPVVRCLLVLAKIAHPVWIIKPSRDELRTAFMQTLTNGDLIRADLLTEIIYRPSSPVEFLGSFERINADMQNRITFHIGEKYELLRKWLLDYRNQEAMELDSFFSLIFGEVLSQPKFGFHDDFEAAAITSHLIDSVTKFRRALAANTLQSTLERGKAYIEMVNKGVIAAQYINRHVSGGENRVSIMPAYSFLMQNQSVDYQFWLDIGSPGWWERVNQPLTHPHVLSRKWETGQRWTDVDEMFHNQIALAGLLKGLLRRCRKHVFMHSIHLNEKGTQTTGELMKAIQILYKKIGSNS
jgi:hypothetical protein